MARLSSMGMLTIVGDNLSNDITIKVAAGSVTITGNGGTLINGRLAVTSPGVVNAIQASMNGGDDTVSIDPSSDFMVPGVVAIALGNGNNNLNLNTSGKISLGALGVAGGTGQDTVTVAGGAGLKSTVVGNSIISLGAGDNTTNLTEMQFMGIGGLMVSGGAGHDALTLKNTSVSAALTGTFGTGGDTVGVTGGTLHNLAVNGDETATSFSNTTVGSVQETGTLMTALTADAVTFSHGIFLTGTDSSSTVTATFSGTDTVANGVAVSGGAAHLSLSSGANLAVTNGVSVMAGGQASLDLPGAQLTAGTVTVSGGSGATYLESDAAALSVAGTMSLSSSDGSVQYDQSGGSAAPGFLMLNGATGATFDPSGAATTTTIAHDLSVQASSGTASIHPTGDTLIVSGNLSAFSGKNVDIALAATPSEVKGTTVVTGGTGADIVTVSSQTKLDHGVLLALGGGNNQVTLGDSSGQLALGGGLVIRAGAGADTVTLRDVQVAGPVAIATGAGTDTVTIEDGSTFNRAFAASLGPGDDTLSVAQETGSATPVDFKGMVSVHGGLGNDTLFLGKSVAAGGDANSKVVFHGGVINGDLGTNKFDATTSQRTGPVTLLNWS